MKLPMLSSVAPAFLAGISLVTPAFAVINIDYVPIGNAGNAADNSTGSPYGAVAYAYQIGKYEVTNAQYTDFLNAVDPAGANANGIYSASMGSDIRGGINYTAGAASGSKYTIRTSMGDKPVNHVSWYDAARFSNWLGNGQGAGSTETGAYTLIGNTGIITKNVGATVWLPSEDEWYKAAYYDPTPGASGDNYWEFPTQSDADPTVGTANATGDISNPGANVANFWGGAGWNDQTGNVTTVGSAAANNFYGTLDQGGNVWEWNDAVIFGSGRGLRGGSWANPLEHNLRASERSGLSAADETYHVGFRVASVPEPTSLVLMMLASGVMFARRKR